MIAAVPVYTVLRIVAKEFLSHYHFIKKLTDDLDDATEPEIKRDKDYPELWAFPKTRYRFYQS